MKILAPSIVLILVTSFASLAPASDHLDSPLVMKDGRLDVNDSYIFQSPEDPGKTVMILTVNPAAGVISPSTFSPAAIYELNVDNNGDAIPDITFSLKFSRPRGNGMLQRYTVRRNGALIARGNTGSDVEVRSTGGGLVRCDLYDDPFFFDLDGFNDGFNFTGNDFFAGLNVSAIVIEIPSISLAGPTLVTAGPLGPKDLNVSLSARTLVNGSQFDRVGRPAINTALIPVGMKDAFNVGLPVNDSASFGAVVQASIESLNGGDTTTAQNLTAILLPDVLTVNLSDASGFLNGRGLADDVIDAELDLLSNGAVTGDLVDSNDVPFPVGFPYLAEPHN